jgi:hypothetical protein
MYRFQPFNYHEGFNSQPSILKPLLMYQKAAPCGVETWVQFLSKKKLGAIGVGFVF